MSEHIFLSYSHSDATFTRQLTKKLEAADMRCWMDESLHVGNYWTAEIDKAMREAYAFIVVLSPEAVISQYVNYEVGFASALRLKIIPVQCSDYDPRKALLHLSQLQAINFMDGRTQAWDRLVSLLRQTRQEHQTVQGQINQLMQGFASESDYEKCKQRLLDLVDYIESHSAAYEELIKAARHQRGSVRLLALHLLAEKTRSQDRRALPLLEQVLKNHEERSDIRQEAIRVLEKIGKDGIPLMIACLNDPDPALSGLASKTIDSMGSESVPHLLQTLDSRATGEHRIRILNRIHRIGAAAIPHLREHITSEHPAISETAAIALRGLTDQSGFTTLVEATSSTSKTARLIAIKTLGRQGDERAAQTLLKILNEHATAESRAAAATALGVIAIPLVARPLFQTVFDLDLDVGRAAYNALVEMREIAVPELAENLLRNPDADQRERAAHILTAIRHESAIPALIRAMDDRNEDVRRQVAAALAQFGDSLVDDLLPILDDHASRRALTAVWALQDVSEPKIVPHLIQALNDGRKSPPALRRAAAKRLGEFKSFLAIPALKRTLNDRDADLQRVAADALRQIGGSEAQSAYDSWSRRRR